MHGWLQSLQTNFPEIVTDILERGLWAWQYVGQDMIDFVSMKAAARFCKANDFTWDVVLTAATSVISTDNASFARARLHNHWR